MKVIGEQWFKKSVRNCIVGDVYEIGIIEVIMGEIEKEEDDGVY